MNNRVFQRPLRPCSSILSAISLALTLAFGLCFGVLGLRAEAPAKTKVVLIAGVQSHPSGQHEFNAGSILLARALNEQSGLPIDVQVVHDGWPADESIFDGAKAVIIYSDGNKRHPILGHEQKMGELIAQGVGLMCMHFAVEVPEGETGELFKKWIGGYYEQGFSTNPHWTAPVEINGKHPIGRGVAGFRANDEWYFSIRFADPKTALGIATSIPTREKITRYIHWTPAGEKSLGSAQALMWAVERQDGGRGIGFTGGHWHRNWAIDDFRKLVLNAIVWTAKLDVPEKGVTSLPISEADLNVNLDSKKKMEHVDLPKEADLNQPVAEPIEFRWPDKK